MQQEFNFRKVQALCMVNFVEEAEGQTTGLLINIWLECLARVTADQNRHLSISYQCKISSLNSGGRHIKISILQHATFTLVQVSQ